jgi:hypothetical protein
VTIWNSAIASRLIFGWLKPRAGNALRDLLAVQIELKLIVTAHAGPFPDAVRCNPLDQQRQLLPVPSLQRQLRHLTSIDVAGHLRRDRIDERRLAGHREAFFQRREFQDEGNRGVLTDEQLDLGYDDGGESHNLRLHLVSARVDIRKPVFATFIRDRDVLAAAADVGSGHGHTGDNRLGLVDHRTEDRGLLLAVEGCRRNHDHERESKESCGHAFSSRPRQTIAAQTVLGESLVGATLRPCDRLVKPLVTCATAVIIDPAAREVRIPDGTRVLSAPRPWRRHVEYCNT